jgi:hypothetical protein
MTPAHPVLAELKPLLDALCEETISPEQLRRLEELVLNHPEAEAHYIRFMSFYADLIGELGGLPQRAPIPLPAQASEPKPAPVPEAARPQPKPAAPKPPPIPTHSSPRSASTKQENPMKRSRIRWELATAALFVLGGLGTLAAFQFSGWRGASRDAAEKQRVLDAARDNLARLQIEQKAAEQAARKDIDATTEAGQKLLKEYQAEIEKAKKDVEAKDFMVRVTGPGHIQPGAPNKWQIETLRGGAIARPKKLDIIVKDAKDAELFRQTDDKPVGAATLELPVSFWEKVKPGSDLFLEVVAYTGEDRKSVLAEKLPLARPVYVTSLATDKPLYKPGEVVRFRSLTLDRATLKPPANDVYMKFNLRDPAGAVVTIDEGNGRVLSDIKPILGPDKKPLRGIGVGDYTLSPDAPGGEYKIELVEVVATNHEVKEVLLETRKFIVNRYVPDVFEKKLEFDGKSYGPGDAVQARLEVSRTAGGPMKNATATVVASVDGKPVFEKQGEKFAIVTDQGAAKAVLNVRFKLPADLFETAKKDTPPSASLSVSIQDGSDAENILRPVPLVTKNLLVEFFPEGGDMVAGIPGRVYFQVRTPAGKPADVRGVITDGTNLVVETGEIKTETDAENEGVNRGHGVFVLTPKPGVKYFLKLASPSGITAPTKDGFPLPEVKGDGIVLRALDPITDRGGAIRVRVEVGKGKKTLHVGAYARGRLIAHQKIEAEAGNPVELALKGDEVAGGVTRVTVFEEPKIEGEGRAQLIPRAERLVYRKPGEQLILNVNPDKARYSPGGKVRLELSAYNEKEQPTPAVLLVAVVNRSVITMADNKTDRLMPTHFLLSGDVKHPAELEHADFLLTDHPKAAVALDLLLGTQGWRRFAEQNGTSIEIADKAEVDRMLVAHGGRTSPPLELFLLAEQAISNDFRPKMEDARRQIMLAQDALHAARAAAGPGLGGQVTAAQADLAAADKEYTEAAAKLYTNETRALRAGSWGMPALFLGLFGLAIGGAVLAVNNPGSRRPYIAASIGLLLLGGLAFWGTVQTRGTDETAQAWKKLNPERDRHDDRAIDGERKFAAKAGARGDAGDEQLAMDFAEGLGMPADGRPMPERGAAPRGGGKFDPKFAPPMPAAPPGFDPARGPQLDGLPKPALREVQKLEDAINKVEKLQREQEKIRARADQPMMGELAKKRPPFPGRPGMGMGNGGMPMGGMPGGRLGGGRGPGGLGDEMAQAGFDISPVGSFYVREYAHQRDSSLGDIRADFTETVYWHPVLVLPDSGKTTIEFQLADDIARYQVLVAGHTTDGRIGAVTKTIESRKPFYLDPKIPLEISHTDTIDVPVRAVNDSDDKRNVAFNVTLTGLKSDANLKDAIDLGPNAKGRKLFRVSASQLQGTAGVMIDGSSGPDRDTIVRSLRVVPDGFPGVGSFSDMIEKRAAGSVTLPKDAVAGSLKVRLEVYPTSMADLVKGLDGMLREPGGCFEQTSTSNYPNTMILDYMNQTNQANPEAAKKAKGMLERGYAKLTSFECPDTPEKKKQGFEWFGGADQQHEALTAYGLLQFKDMARVTQVDPQLIKRTQAFLMSRRDGNGGFKRNQRALDQFGGAPDHTTNAYIVWALVESDPEDAEHMDLQKEIAALKRQAIDENSVAGKDAYFVALVANVLIQRGDREAAHKLLDRLQEKNTKEGKVTGAVTSITRSGGQALEIETTALAMLGWLRANDPKYITTIKDVTKWISQQRGGYGAYASTQSTILALKALTLYAKKTAHPAESGEIQVMIGGKKVATRQFSEKDVEVIGLDIEKPEEFFKFGAKTEVEIVTDAKQPYPFALSYTYTTLTPVSAEKCAVAISTKLAKTEANEGDTVPLTVTLDNRQKQDQGMAVAIIGLPAGMKVPTDMKQLTDLREKGVISFFETRDRELILYWRGLAPEKKIELTVDLVCDVPGVYRGPASRGYLYYNADHKHWVEPLSIKIAPLAGKDEAAK